MSWNSLSDPSEEFTMVQYFNETVLDWMTLPLSYKETTNKIWWSLCLKEGLQRRKRIVAIRRQTLQVPLGRVELTAL